MMWRKINKAFYPYLETQKTRLSSPFHRVLPSFPKLRISSFFILLAVFFLLFSPLLGADTTYYVDPQNGYDENNGLSPQSPWQSIQKANRSLKPGDTVYLMAGTYHQTIKPEDSGESGQPITYARYQNDEVIISDVTMGVDLRNKHYVVIDGLTIRNTKHWVYMRFQPSTHNTIKNCHMEKCTTGWAGIYMGGDVDREGNSHHNKILNNTLKGKCRPNNLIQCSSGATYNLIQGNEFFYGPHAAVEVEGRSYPTHHNIIKDNVFHNYYHTALIVYTNAHHTLIEGNIFMDSGEKYSQNDCGSESDRSAAPRYHRAIQLGASYCIIRKNVLVNNGSLCLESKEDESSLARHNRIYHNTLYKNHMALYSNCEGSVDQNILKNNIFYKNIDYEIHRYVTGHPQKDFFIHNNIQGAPIYHYPDGEVSVAFMQNHYPQMWKNNLSQNPLFKDEEERNFHLSPSSPMIDAGAFLTQTTSPGSGKQIPVKDARYFMDGWEVVQGDTVQLEGDIQTATVTKVDYENHILYVDRTLSWYSGQRISLAHSGYAPDLGAYEYGEFKPVEADINASPSNKNPSPPSPNKERI
ncbi:right-handed parallel beta-helix repeat-containing protein [bacterium]|nr:right-handed parallel beta-helix repeat-containing protein [bacterium]